MPRITVVATIKETTMNYVLIGLPGSGKSTLGVFWTQTSSYRKAPENFCGKS